MPDIDPLKIGKPMSPEHPKTLGRYDLLRVLGQGGMGTVFLAKQHNLGRLVALKLLGGARKVREDWRMRFELEIDALARLHHPNIVAILDRGEDDGRLFYVMEFIDGVPLRRFIKKPQKFQAIVRIAYKVCLALEKVHHEHLVHRDLKPDNILIDRYGEVKLTDFGIVKAVQKPGESAVDANVPMLTGQGATIGTAAYMAPEQMFGRGEIGPPADVYAMGVMFHELVVGLRPEPDMPKVTAIVPGLPVWVDEFLNFCLHIDPKRRFANGNELKKFLTIHANKVKGNFPMVGTVPAMLGGKAGAKPASTPMKLPSGRKKASPAPLPASDDNWGGSPDLATALKHGATGDGGDGDESIVSAEPVASATSPVGKARDKRASTVRAQQKMQRAKSAVRAVEARAEDSDDFLLSLDEEAAAAMPVAPSAASAIVQPTQWSVRKCPRCKGSGKSRRMLVLSKACKLCESSGRVYRQRREVKRLRLMYWLMMLMALAVTGGAGWLAVTRVMQAGDPASLPLAFLGALPLPLIAMAVLAAVVLIVLWAMDVAAQQNWQPTDLLPNGSVVWPASGSVRRLMIGTLFSLALVVAGGVVLGQVLQPEKTNGPGPNVPPAVDERHPGLTTEQLKALGLDVPPEYRDASIMNSEERERKAWENHQPNPRSAHWEYRRTRDNSRMVFIPPGPVTVGNPTGATDDFGNAVPAAETPDVKLELSGFFMDVREITALQFHGFLVANQQDLGNSMEDNVHYVFRKRDNVVLAYDSRDVITHRSKLLTDPEGFSVRPSDLPGVRGGLVWVNDPPGWDLPDSQLQDLPMIFVTWHGAQAYARWAGGRLPTEIEWEKAAVPDLGRQQQDDRAQYPWGRAFLYEGVARDRSNTASRVAPVPVNAAQLAPLMQDAAFRKKLQPQETSWDRNDDWSPFRVSMLGGNVSEWCFNVYDPELYKELRKLNNAPSALASRMLQPSTEQRGALRGGAYDEPVELVRSRNRRGAPVSYASWRIGFRCVIPMPDDENATMSPGN